MEKKSIALHPLIVPVFSPGRSLVIERCPSTPFSLAGALADPRAVKDVY
jgi:hypothetical protein